MLRALHFIILLLCVGCCSCNNKQKRLPLSESKITPKLDDTQIANAVNEYLIFDNKVDSLLIAAGEKIKAEGSYAPVLSKKKGFDDLRILLDYLKQGRQHGLGKYFEPEVVYMNRQLTQYDSLNYKNFKKTIHYDSLARLDVYAKKAFIKYCKVMEFGLLDPKQVPWAKYELPVEYPTEDYYRSLFEENDIKGRLENAYPKHRLYAPLQKKYADMLASGDTSEWVLLPALPKNKIEIGDKYAAIPLLKERFGVAGPKKVDSTGKEIKPSIRHDTILSNALKPFQLANGLTDDGVIGPATYKALNRSRQENLESMAASLERFRWQHGVKDSPLLLVNIPDYKLKIFEHGKQVREHKICVGLKHPRNYYKYTNADRPKTVKSWETPEFYDTLEIAVLNPRWNVPYSIRSREMLPHVQANPYYFVEGNYNVYYKGQLVNTDTVNWYQYTQDNFPFKVVQNAGDLNALGRVKFLFPNKYSIYLHDTPSKSYFNRDVRAVSHGCMRVEKPFELGDFLMPDNADYEKYKKTEDYKEVPIDKNYPVMITYYTSWVENGVVQFRNDIYGKDEILIKILKEQIKF